MVDDTYYITPHETALATVATAMKKARLKLVTLAINSVVGGFLFSAGSMLYISFHQESPPSVAGSQASMANFLNGVPFGICLFYVVITGADLFNSNILFFTVGWLRNAVTIYDLLISWFVSLIGNFAGSLFMSYVLVHLSGIGHHWKDVSVTLGDSKVASSFIQTFLKGIGGNFFVCLAIYLQLMAKPIHVKLFLIILPIFTFCGIGFTHTVADMGIMYVSMLNGANVSVGKYIWKLLIPATLGNIVGGFAFSFIIPFYLHLYVVEQDRKELSLPEYEARDEQPELNMDSRVVRIPAREQEEFDDASDEDEISEKLDEESGSNASKIAVKHISTHDDDDATGSIRTPTAADNGSSMSNVAASFYSDNGTYSTGTPEPFHPGREPEGKTVGRSKSDTSTGELLRRWTTKNKRGKVHIRSPPGVFPVRGMGTPLLKERTIEDPTIDEDLLDDTGVSKASSSKSSSGLRDSNILKKVNTISIGSHGREKARLLNRIKTMERAKQNDYTMSGRYNVLEKKPSAQLGRTLTKIMTHRGKYDLNSADHEGQLPRTNQDVGITSRSEFSGSDTKQPQGKRSGLFKVFTKQFERSNKADSGISVDDRLRSLGISPRVATMANNTAGVENFSNIHTPPRRARTRSHSGSPQSNNHSSVRTTRPSRTSVAVSAVNSLPASAIQSIASRGSSGSTHGTPYNVTPAVTR